MRKFISVVLTVLIIVGSMFIFTGCPANEPLNQENLAVVVGNHRHFPKVNLNSSSIFDKIFNACFSYGKIAVIVSDGEAYLAGNYTISQPDVSVDNAKKKQIAKKNANQIISECSQANAITPEIDTLKAIAMAADTISSLDGDKTITIIDSGLSTTGLMDFSSQNLIDADPQLIVQQIDEFHSIPDLNGCNIEWFGCGQTSGSEQQKLPESYKYKLEKLWDTILKAGGASEVTFNSEPLPDTENDASLPYCSVVAVVDDKLVIDDAMPQIVKFDQEKISFVSNKAEFLNEGDAYDALEPIADMLKADVSQKVVIVGSTASDGSAEGCRRLSQMRADKVKDTLIELEVDPAQLSTYGAGSENTPLRVNDIKNGKIIESEAAKNRAVFIINTDSAIAENFI